MLALSRWLAACQSLFSFTGFSLSGSLSLSGWFYLSHTHTGLLALSPVRLLFTELTSPMFYCHCTSSGVLLLRRRLIPSERKKGRKEGQHRRRRRLWASYALRRQSVSPNRRRQQQQRHRPRCQNSRQHRDRQLPFGWLERRMPIVIGANYS